MSDADRLAALQSAVGYYAASGIAMDPGSALHHAPDVVRIADIFYQFLTGPAVLSLTPAALTYEQGSQAGPGTPTLLKGPHLVQLTDTQQVLLSVAEADSKGSPVSDQLSWAVDNPGVIAIAPSADTQSCECVAGVPGTATVTVTDNSVTPPLTGSEAFTVVAGAATSLVITAGTPQDQPPAGG